MTAKPIIPWMGGKGKLAKEILPLIPEHVTYVEAFCGGAAIFFAKEPSKCEVLNDLNNDVANLYRVVNHHLEEFIRHFKWSLTSSKMFEWEKLKRIETLTDIQRAARFYYLQKLAFGARADKPVYGRSRKRPPGLNLLRIEEDLSMAHLRLARVNVESMDWAKCVEYYDTDETFFYLEPPYWQTAGYGNEFGFEHYENMAKLMKEVKGKIMISINDHPDIRNCFAEFKIKPVKIKYTVGRVKNGKQSGELIIMNY